jgi:hypothetical protein
VQFAPIAPTWLKTGFRFDMSSPIWITRSCNVSPEKHKHLGNNIGSIKDRNTKCSCSFKIDLLVAAQFMAASCHISASFLRKNENLFFHVTLQMTLWLIIVPLSKFHSELCPTKQSDIHRTQFREKFQPHRTTLQMHAACTFKSDFLNYDIIMFAIQIQIYIPLLNCNAYNSHYEFQMSYWRQVYQGQPFASNIYIYK